MILLRLALAAGMAAAALALAPAHGLAAAKKEPPACGAVSFRPLAPGMSDGEHRSGHYRSRFGSIDLFAKVEGGQTVGYHMQLNGSAPEAYTGEIPKSAEACLKSKHVKLPVESVAGACTGSRFRVVIDRSTKQPLAMLFGLDGDAWKLCSAAKA